MNSGERVIKTFEGKRPDRLPVFDIIHNTEFIEKVCGRKITPQNAEDLTCEAIRRTLDLVRHFCIPADLEAREVTDEDGFVYRDEWWTREIIKRPFCTLGEAADLMKKDIEHIYRCIDQEKFCHQAKEQVNLFGERYSYPEEVNKRFAQVAGKLGDTVMIAPEIVPGLYTAQHRFGFDMLIFIQYDHPELFGSYYDALVDHELFRIDSFGTTGLSRIALVSESIAFNTGLIWPPAFIRKEVLPRVKKCVDRLKTHDYYVIWHSDGNKWDVIPDFLEMGVDSVNPCEPLAAMEVKRFRELYPDTVIGSMIDCQDMLAFGTPDEVVQATRRAIENSGGARTLIGSTSEIHPGINTANALAMFETARNYTP